MKTWSDVKGQVDDLTRNAKACKWSGTAWVDVKFPDSQRSILNDSKKRSWGGEGLRLDRDEFLITRRASIVHGHQGGKIDQLEDVHRCNSVVKFKHLDRRNHVSLRATWSLIIIPGPLNLHLTCNEAATMLDEVVKAYIGNWINKANICELIPNCRWKHGDLVTQSW